MNKYLTPLNDEDLEDWWLRVPGARRFINAIASEAELNKAIVADIVDVDFEGFISMFNDIIQRHNYSTVIEHFDLNEEIELDDFITDLAIKFNPNYVPDLMSDSMVMDVASKNILSKYIIFIRVHSQINWLPSLVSDFNKVESSEKGTLIFLTSDVMPSQFTIKLMDYILPYDVQFFAFNLLEGSRLSQTEKLFTATLTSKLAGTSAIIAKSLASSELFFNGQSFAEYVLGEDFNSHKFNRALWETQIQFALPIVETIRENIIDKNLFELKKILPVADEFGKFLDNPWDMELRHLHFYGGSAKIFSQTDWDILELVYRVRNDLSHLDSIDVDRLKKIFALAED